MLVTTTKMLTTARRDHYAIGAFNVENLEFIMAVLAAAEQCNSPVIMQTTSATIRHAGVDYFYSMVSAGGEDRSEKREKTTSSHFFAEAK